VLIVVKTKVITRNYYLIKLNNTKCERKKYEWIKANKQMKKLLALCTVELHGFKLIQVNLLMFVLLHLFNLLSFIFIYHNIIIET